jgi:hypothetical protein
MNGPFNEIQYSMVGDRLSIIDDVWVVNGRRASCVVLSSLVPRAIPIPAAGSYPRGNEQKQEASQPPAGLLASWFLFLLLVLG